MISKTQKGSGSSSGKRANKKKPSEPVAGKELNYILGLTAQDTQLLKRYQPILTQGAASFAEVTYNYLFDNPEIADVLYAFERAGGNAGSLARNVLEHMLDLLNGSINDKATVISEKIGRIHQQWCVKPVWTLGVYRLYLEHLQQLVVTMEDISGEDRANLALAITKIIFRDIGITTEGYWRQTVEQISQQRDELGAEQALAVELLSNVPQLLWTVDVESNQISYASPGTQQFCSSSLDAPIPCFQHIDHSERERVLIAWKKVIDGESVQLEVLMNLDAEADDSTEHWHRIAFYPVANRRGRVLRVHCLMEDVSNQYQQRKQLERVSTMDEVTGLANRTLWYERLEFALVVTRRNPGTSIAVMVLDINQFKIYNDSLGREAGDALLLQIANRLQEVVHDTDTLARLGGDEFGVILPIVQSAGKTSKQVADEIITSLSKPFFHRGKELCLSGSIGIALYPQHGENAHSLVSHADSAMYRAKWSGAPYAFYESGSNTAQIEQLEFSGQLHGALERNEFELYYQPKIELSSGRFCGAEALLRWKHPQQGMVEPKRFIPIAEQLGMITPITDWVLDMALKQSKAWRKSGINRPISINVSARSFQSPGLCERISQALEDANVEGKELELEITEGTVMADFSEGSRILQNLSELGVSIAIDDFGTGYSSLAYLKNLPVDVLKIDQSFLENMSTDASDAAVVRSIIELGHNLGCKVVAEGVEQESVRAQLRELGCDVAQGFHISKPLPNDRFNDWLAKSSVH